MEYQVTLRFGETGYSEGDPMYTVFEKTYRAGDLNDLVFIWHTLEDLADRWDGPTLLSGEWAQRESSFGDGYGHWKLLDMTGVL